MKQLWLTVQSKEQDETEFQSKEQDERKSAGSVGPFTYVRMLGTGSFGSVTLVRGSNGLFYAKKECTRSKYDRHTQHEAEIMNSLRGCESIVELIETVPNRSGVDLIMQRCDGSLLDLIHKSNYTGLSEAVVTDLARDMIQAIRFMRERSISHCDLKPENILYQKEPARTSGVRFLVADFGNAERGDTLSPFHRIQTNHYRCGENILASILDRQRDTQIKVNSFLQIEGEVYKKQCTDLRSCDYASLGCILCEAITGDYLIHLDENQEEDQLDMILSFVGRDKLEQLLPHLDSEWKDFLSPLRMLIISDLEQTGMFMYIVKQLERFRHSQIWMELIRDLVMPFPEFRIQAEEASELMSFL